MLRILYFRRPDMPLYEFTKGGSSFGKHERISFMLGS
jgi:hypothetical protein